MLFHSLVRALAIAIWNSSLRSFAPYDGRRDKRYADRYDERYDRRDDRRDDGQWATTLTRPGRGYRDSDRDEDPPRQPARGRTVALLGLALAALLVVAATVAIEAQLAASGRPTGRNSTGLTGNGSGAPSSGPTVSATAPTIS